MASKHAASNVWSFNHRVRTGYLSDSDSKNGSDSEDVPGAGDARLAQEMDLSVRQETVQYRPNPWSIAKINAASRTSGSHLRPTAPPPRASGKSLPPPKPQPKRIVEAFRKQAEREERRKGQPVVSAGRKGEKASGVLAQREHGRPAEEPNQGNMVETHNLDLGPKTVPRHPVQLAETPPKQKGAHISTSSGDRAHSGLAFPPSKLYLDTSHNGRRPLIQSSPLRRRSPMVRPRKVLTRLEVPAAGASRPTIHHSSPAPRPIPRQGTPPPGNKSSSATLPCWLSTALDHGLKSPPPTPQLAIDPKASTHVPERTHIATPEPKRKRLPSPPPIPKLKKTRVTGSRSGPSAYAFGEDLDPDETWSTLPSRRVAKKAVLTKPRGMKQSGCFRLPIPGLLQKMTKQVPQRTTTTPAQAPDVKRRVITYLPPPMAIRKPAESEDAPIKHQQERASSPEQVADEDVEIRVMDSDETLVNDDDGETMVGYDVDGVSAAYGQTRADMKELRRIGKMIPCIVEIASLG